MTSPRAATPKLPFRAARVSKRCRSGWSATSADTHPRAPSPPNSPSEPRASASGAAAACQHRPPTPIPAHLDPKALLPSRARKRAVPRGPASTVRRHPSPLTATPKLPFRAARVSKRCRSGWSATSSGTHPRAPSPPWDTGDSTAIPSARWRSAHNERIGDSGPQIAEG